MIEALTPAEWKIARAIAYTGLNYFAIADRFKVSRMTVATHVSNISQKLGIALNKNQRRRYSIPAIITRFVFEYEARHGGNNGSPPT